MHCCDGNDHDHRLGVPCRSASRLALLLPDGTALQRNRPKHRRQALLPALQVAVPRRSAWRGWQGKSRAASTHTDVAGKIPCIIVLSKLRLVHVLPGPGRVERERPSTLPPTGSKARSAPFPPVPLSTLARRSSSARSTTTSAPDHFARSTSAAEETTALGMAPSALLSWISACPADPDAQEISTVCPSFTCPMRVKAW